MAALSSVVAQRGGHLAEGLHILASLLASANERDPGGRGPIDPGESDSIDRRRFLRLLGAFGSAGVITVGTAGSAIASRPRTRPASANDASPNGGGRLVVSGRVVLRRSRSVSSVVVEPGGELIFHPKRNVTLRSTGNIVVAGRLSMRPDGARLHRIIFQGVDESAFVGGGEDPIDSDVGLWIVGRGRLDMAGTPKTGWLRASSQLDAGATEVTLEEAPQGWRAGDEIVVVPTRAGDMTGFEVRTIRSLAGATMRLSSPLEHPHPAVDGLTAEVANLTRSVRIEGTPNGRTHVFIGSSEPQKIRHTAIRHVGPRSSDFVPGRYGLHMHHMHNASRGSLVEGVVIRDSGSHSFVPHASHGITIRDSVAYDVFKEAYWWDRPPDPMHNDSEDSVWDHCLAARVRGYGSEDIRASGFMLGSSGTNGNAPSNFIRDSAAVGVDGEGKAMSGFQWPTGQSEPWEFARGLMVAHNCLNGIFVWSNDAFSHDVDNFRSYHNGTGILHGAYKNVYRYDGARIIGSSDAAVELLATSGDAREARMDNIHIEDAPVGLRVREHNLPPEQPSVLSNWTLVNVSTPIQVDEAGTDNPIRLNLVNWRVGDRALRCDDFSLLDIHPQTVIRVLDGGNLLFTITASGCG